MYSNSIDPTVWILSRLGKNNTYLHRCILRFGLCKRISRMSILLFRSRSRTANVFRISRFFVVFMSINIFVQRLALLCRRRRTSVYHRPAPLIALLASRTPAVPTFLFLLYYIRILNNVQVSFDLMIFFFLLINK